MVLKSCKQKFPPIGDSAERTTTSEMFCCRLLSKTGVGLGLFPAMFDGQILENYRLVGGDTLKCLVNWLKLYIKHRYMCEKHTCACVVFSNSSLPFQVFCSWQRPGEIFSVMCEKNITCNRKKINVFCHCGP